MIIEKLNGDHEVSKFDCGDDELNGFLCENSLPEMKAQMNVTYVCKHDLAIVAYFTLSSDLIELNPDDKNHFEEKRGIGTEIILRVVGCLFKLSNKVGMRFVSVDSYGDSANFYRKNNFVELIKGNQKKTYVAMYFDPFRPYG